MDVEFCPVDMSELDFEVIEDIQLALEVMEKAAALLINNYPERNVWPLWILN